MTNQEAIEIIKQLSEGLNDKGIIRESNEIDIKHIEKQIANKPNIETFNDIMRKQKCYKVKCPKCGEKFFVLEFINDKDRRFVEFGEWLKHCYNCGQKIDWKVEK